jgi:hypothetical protein
MQAHMAPLAEAFPMPNVRVSTRFLGSDQRKTKAGAPLLWETMIFGGAHNLHQERYTSQADALKGHEKAVAMAKDENN